MIIKNMGISSRQESITGFNKIPSTCRIQLDIVPRSTISNNAANGNSRTKTTMQTAAEI